MASNPDHPTPRRCACGGADPHCPQCGGHGAGAAPGVRPIMAGPAGVRRRLVVSQASPVTPASLGPPEPARCPHCGFDVLYLAVHVTEAHPELAEELSAAEREAKEQEAARQARVAAELAEREAEAARRKAEARARRQEVEGPQTPVVRPAPARGSLLAQPPGKPPDAAHGGPAQDAPGDAAHAAANASPPAPPARPAGDAWARLRTALAEGSVVTGVVRSVKPFGMFVDVGGIEGLVRRRDMPGEGGGPGPHEGQSVQVVVIGMSDDPRRVELSMRRTGAPRTPPAARDTSQAAARRPESPMALAFRLAREKKQRAE